MDHGGAGRSVAERLVRVAENLIGSGNFAGSKKIAVEALESDPLVDGADQILAVADVLLASKRRINNHQIDHYSVLQLDPASSGRDPLTVRRHYRRLALLLRRSPLPGARDAYRAVADAWAVLSDPSKKSLLDAEVHIPDKPPHPAAAATAAASNPTFWTACTSCFHVHQYDGAYEGCFLICQSCRRSFHAAALEAPPPVVPGTDMYYCTWGFFPLGFSTGVDGGYTPFYPVPPPSGNVGARGGKPPTGGDKGYAVPVNLPTGGDKSNAVPENLPTGGDKGYAVPVNLPTGGDKSNAVPENLPTGGDKGNAVPENPPPRSRIKKVTAKKSVVNKFKERVFVVQPELKSEAAGPVDCDGLVAAMPVSVAAPLVIDINEDAGSWEAKDKGVIVDEDDVADGFYLDLDVVDLEATSDLLGNLTDLSKEVQVMQE